MHLEILKKNKIKKDGGAALMIFMIIFLVISLAVTTSIVSPVISSFSTAKDVLNSERSYYLSESGIEDAFYRVGHAMDIGGSETLVLGTYSATTTITDLSDNQKRIETLSDFNDYFRRLSVDLQTGEGVSFNYGLQIGSSGISLASGAGVVGSVYSNGRISGIASSSYITGSAFSANGSAATLDQSNTTPASPPYSVNFGNSASTQDFATSFVPALAQFDPPNNNQVIKIKTYIKKVGSPSNATVRITTNTSSRPGTTLCSATLSPSLVTTSFGWIEIPMSVNCGVVAGTTYWIVWDASTDASNYYVMAGNTSYTSGTGKIGTFSPILWNNTSPSGIDGYFEVYVGGLQGQISGVIVGTSGVGDANAYRVQNSTVEGALYCQQGSGNNKSCDTSASQPGQSAMPVSDAQIASWKSVATAGGTYVGNYSITGTQSLGPRKIQGNLILNNNAILNITGTVYVTGTITMNQNSIIRLDSSYGSRSGIIIADGSVTTYNNATFEGSGVSGSYVLAAILGTANPTVSISNNAGAVVIYAPNGIVSLSNNATAKSIAAKQLSTGNNAIINYEDGIADANFVNGPSGSYNVLSWRETD